MATFQKVLLSGSSNGRGIKVAATSSSGTTVHTATSASGAIDEVWIYAMNTDSSTRKLTLEWGGTTSPDDLIEITLDSEPGLTLIVPGLPLDGGAVVRAFAASGDVVTIHGYVNRIE